ncbi:ATP12 family chaperone protein [Pseudahrensia aquimaris]|uniref:ATP12 family chaperone protein n=1 Tax=Pseudahrensia aquimaris TaxID=744461 RepID=A0ABW3FP04_9HYPH
MSDILGERDPNIPQTPTRVAEPSREEQLPKRFYKEVSLDEAQGAFTILLDGRSVKTPGRNTLEFTHQGLAQAVADEWAAQGERIDPMKMPLTRLVNTALDGVARDMQAVKEDIVRYSGTDLICYRAEGPQGLIDAQREHWDPLLDFAQETFGCHFHLAEGVMHVAQPPESIAAFSAHVGQIDEPLVLAATHVVTTLTGSATIGMAVFKGALDADAAWKAAHVDEDWNISQWGEDAEAQAVRARKFEELRAAVSIIDALTR